MVNINSLERDGLRQAELCPRHTMKMKTKNILIPDRSQLFSKDNPTGHSERKKEKEADSRRGGKTISKSGPEWTLPAQLGQLKTGQDGKGLLQIQLWCPDDLPRLWDRIE